MHHLYFPACPVEGAIDPPVPYGHMVKSGAIPHKCGNCDKLFEGGCTRFIEDVQRYMHLDFGPCGIDGPTDPVFYEDRFLKSKVEIPRKCAGCVHLVTDSIYGFTCKKDSDKWGDNFRGLDWGSWSPDRIYVELPPPKITTKALINCVHDDDLKGFLVEYRRVNLGVSLREGRADFEHLKSVVAK